MTPLLANLQQEIARLSRVYLPATPSILPSADEQERARAFVLLSHAEIEWFLERASANYSEHIRDAAVRGEFNFSSLALVAFSEAKMPLGDSLGTRGKSVATIFGKLHADMLAIIESNNGIREKNLVKIFGPLGLSGLLDPSWLDDLDSYASLRGRYAHMSGPDAAKVIATINPSDAKALCDRIIDGAQVPGITKIACVRDLDAAFEAWKTGFSDLVSSSRANAIGMALIKRRVLLLLRHGWRGVATARDRG